jgi:hypothetical protein
MVIMKTGPFVLECLALVPQTVAQESQHQPILHLLHLRLQLPQKVRSLTVPKIMMVLDRRAPVKEVAMVMAEKVAVISGPKHQKSQHHLRNPLCLHQQFQPSFQDLLPNQDPLNLLVPTVLAALMRDLKSSQ